MNERTLSKTQFLIEGSGDGTKIRTFRRRRTTALFTKGGKFVRRMDWKGFNQLSEQERQTHTLETVWILVDNQD